MRITVRQLDFAYDGRPVLEDISLEVEPGEILTLVGPNGSGKSTLLKNIAGVLRPRNGVVYLDFKRLERFPPRVLARHLAAVEQERRVGFDFTVRELVELGRLPHVGRLQRLKERDRAAIERAMHLTKITALAERPLSALSGGERQRAFLALALAQEPKILLLDEPTAHLDISYQLEFMELVRAQAQAGLTVLLALHDLNLAAHYADRIGLLKQGRLRALGRPEAVLTPELIEEVFGVRTLVRYNPITNRPFIELLPPSSRSQGAEGLLERGRGRPGRARVHLICGGGSGSALLQRLSENYRLSAGVLSPLDSDYELARQLDIELALEAPFAPISPEAYEKNLQLLKRADAVIVGEVPFGPGNLKNLEALREVPAEKIYLLDPQGIAERDYTGGRATELIRELLARGAHPVSDITELERRLATDLADKI